MEFINTKLADAKLIKPLVHGDDRGFFLESWRKNVFDNQLNLNTTLEFVQENHSGSTQGVLRGLHFQKNFPQGKLVRVVKGEVYDVIVDLRPQSPTFGQWQGFTLSSTNKLILWSPPGFAHGFYVLSDSAEFIYKCTDYYHPEDEYSLLWNDPELKIEWPIIKNTQPILSKKDEQGKLLSEIAAIPAK